MLKIMFNFGISWAAGIYSSFCFCFFDSQSDGAPWLTLYELPRAKGSDFFTVLKNVIFILNGLGARQLSEMFHFWVNYCKWSGLGMNSPAEGIRGSQDGAHRLTLKGECAEGLGKFLFFHRGWSWLCVNGTHSGRRAPVLLSGPVCPAGTLYFSHHEALGLLHTGTALAGGPKWWAELSFIFLLSCYYYFKTQRKSKIVFLFLEKEINWMCRVCQWWKWKPNSWFLVKTYD